MTVEVRIVGLNELMARLSSPQTLLAGPMGRFFERSAIVVENRAKQKAPVDVGRLRSSIAHEVDSSAIPMWAKVGTNVQYGPYMEFGTGRLSDAPGGGSSRHFPPPAALDRWASRHGFGPGGGFIVARAIARRGGLKPRRYLRGGLEESVSDIGGLLVRAGREIEDEWGR